MEKWDKKKKKIVFHHMYFGRNDEKNEIIKNKLLLFPYFKKLEVIFYFSFHCYFLFNIFS